MSNATRHSTNNTPVPVTNDVLTKLKCLFTGHVNIYHSSSLRLLSQLRQHSTNGRRKSREKKPISQNVASKEDESIDDLKSIMESKSMSLTSKFKILFQQYGVVLVVVHSITAAFWMGLFYYAVSRYGVLEKRKLLQ